VAVPSFYRLSVGGVLTDPQSLPLLLLGSTQGGEVETVDGRDWDVSKRKSEGSRITNENSLKVVWSTVMCSCAGLALGFVPHDPRAGVDGATRPDVLG
jgi:hypothetical protein